MTGQEVTPRSHAVRRAHTPDAGGYALAVLVSIAVADVLVSLLWASRRDAQGLLAALVVGFVYVSVLALPTAPVGVLLVHACCRCTGRQWVHVVAAGAVGALLGLGFAALASGVAGPFRGPGLAFVLGVAAATGRAAVIPLRPPVDDDFVDRRPAC
jgi:hypothetical protein